MRSRIALASARAAWGVDPDEGVVLAALRARGVAAEPAAWDDPAVDWAVFDLVVLRSTWDYPERLAAFHAWVDAVASVTRVVNPPAVVRGNTDKRYLARLADAGVPVVPTWFAEPGEDPALPRDEPFVVKPAVSAGSRDAVRAEPGETARPRALIERLHARGRTVMVQPYLDSVDARGETAVIHLDGVCSHGVRKGPILVPGAEPLDGLHAPEDLRLRDPRHDERAVAEAALAALDATGLAYARVDLVDDAAGAPRVLEVELTEPSLFLRLAPGAPERFAAALARRLPTREHGDAPGGAAAGSGGPGEAVGD